MEQELDPSGFNWQRYYPNVHRGAKHSYPTFWVVCNSLEETQEIERLAQKHLMARFYLDNTWNVESFTTRDLVAPNITIISLEMLSEEDKIQIWKNIDYIICPDTSSLLLPALFSGVNKVELTDIEKTVEDFSRQETSILRVDAFDKGRNLLDALAKNHYN